MGSWRAAVGLSVMMAGCGSATREAPASEVPEASEQTPVSAAAAAPEAPAADATTDVVATANRPDLLSCVLVPRVHELGEMGDGEPSAPVVLGDSVVVAFTRTPASGGGAGSDLLVQRVLADGTLAAPVLVRTGVHFGRPVLVGHQGCAYVMAVNASGAAEAIALDPATGAESADAPITLGLIPEDAALGPRGLVLTQLVTTRQRHRAVRRMNTTGGVLTDVSLPGPSSWPGTREQILASGGDFDAVLVRHGHGVSAAAIDATGAVHRSTRLFRGTASSEGGIWTEASIAAGPVGFALVRGGPGIGDLQLFLAGADGAFTANAVTIPPPASATGHLDSLVRRYPRAAALGGGWALSYWDGVGPSLVRVDGAGRLTADAIEIRSGDERGGHTDGTMIATEDAIAISWQVSPPMMSHGFAEEQPRRPGPRLAILRCAAP